MFIEINIQEVKIMKKTQILRRIGFTITSIAAAGVIVAQAMPVFGSLFYNGTVVRTIVPPAAMKKVGNDNLYVIMEGAEGQLPIAGVAPGDPDYNGGKWAFHAVTWNVTPYLLESESDVQDAETDGDVTISRDPSLDFKCPVQP